MEGTTLTELAKLVADFISKRDWNKYHTPKNLAMSISIEAAEIMESFSVQACTDITGFGLLGHLAEMVQDSGCGVRLDSKRIPILPDTVSYASMGLIPAGAYRNREFYQPIVIFDSSVERVIQDILFDPQTSGGLLICIGKDEADELLEGLKGKSVRDAAMIGEVISEPTEKILVT